MLLGGGLVLFTLVAGPRAALRILGFTGDQEVQRTSQVDLKVANEADQLPQLDFVVPGKPQPVKTDGGVDQKFNSLQDQLDRLRNKQSGLSAADVQRLLDSYNDAMSRKLESERKAMAAQVAQLKSDAEAQKLRDAQAKQQQDLDQKQRESKAVVVDDGSTASEPGVITGDISQQGRNQQDLDSNGRFLASAASSVVQTSVAKTLSDPSRTVVQGTIISAVLESAVDTELPGSIRAQVTQAVYSFDGTAVLMAPGTVLIGQFNNDIDVAQKRVLIAWNRAITPDGKSIELGSIGTDTLGRSGTLGNVDNRYLTKFGAAVLISAITAAPDLIANRAGNNQSGSSGTTINVGGGGGNKLGSSVTSAAGEQGSDMLQKYLSLPPVIRIPQGEEIRVFANRDLVFP
ncbi:MAG: conjugal transfer protein [Mesorhizobium sp.]|nr:MAG: conjugal transfer protein [Mesorhizobium sp.]